MHEEEYMTEKEQTTFLIDCYTNLLRIKVANNRDDEINNQLVTVKAKLEAMGVVTENIEIK